MVLTRAARRALQELEEDFPTHFCTTETESTASASSSKEDSNLTWKEGGKEEEDRKGEKEEEEGPVFNRLSIGTINIRNGNGGNLEMASRELSRLGLDIVVVTKAKLKRGRHTSLAYGYEVTATNCENSHQGGVALLVKRVKKEKERKWHIEDIVCFGPNVLKCTLVYGRQGRH